VASTLLPVSIGTLAILLLHSSSPAVKPEQPIRWASLFRRAPPARIENENKQMENQTERPGAL
jgi:hypothetical protein